MTHRVRAHRPAARERPSTPLRHRLSVIVTFVSVIALTLNAWIGPGAPIACVRPLTSQP